MLCFGFGVFVALSCFCFLFCKCFGIPNSPRSLDLDDRQGLIASSAMQQKKTSRRRDSSVPERSRLRTSESGANAGGSRPSLFDGLSSGFSPFGAVRNLGASVTEKRNRVFTILDSMLRQRFTDMRNVGFLLLTAHPSSKWMDPAFSPQKEKVVVVYSDEVLQGSASVLLRLSLPPHDAEGAIYVRRRLRLRYLIRQLGISLLCGDVGAECLCYVNGMELSNDREMAVDDAAFIHCWGLPAADSEEADLITIGDSISQHSVDVHMPVSEFALTSPCDHLRDGAPS